MTDNMYKVMLVDDEMFIRKSLKNRIAWERLGLQVAAEAENGVEALELLEQVKPQIVFVDIRMPLMDGLAFISEAGKRHPNVHYIITSAYDDFEYARQAVRLGVDDYILKPVKVHEVEQLLEKTVHKLTEERISRQLKETMTTDGILTKTQGEKVCAIAFYVEDSEGVESIIYSGLSAALEQVKIYQLKEYSRTDCYVYLLSGDALDEHEIFEASVKVWAELGKKEGSTAWSDILPGSEVMEAARRCVRLLKSKLFFPGKKILREGSYRKENGTLGDEHQKQVQQILNSTYKQLPNGNYAVIREDLMRLPDLIVDRNNRIIMMESCIMELMVLLKRIVQQELDEMETDILFHRLREKDYLLRFRTEEELKNSLRELIQYAFESQDRGEKKDLITGIKDYIRSNYSENLSAADIARVFFLNTSYLSTLFKEKSGMTMTAYIEAVRMEKARQLLQKRELSITEVAMYTGYSDPNYFSKVFRKYTNMSPRRYRDEMSPEEEIK